MRVDTQDQDCDRRENLHATQSREARNERAEQCEAMSIALAFDASDPDGVWSEACSAPPGDLLGRLISDTLDTWDEEALGGAAEELTLLSRMLNPKESSFVRLSAELISNQLDRLAKRMWVLAELERRARKARLKLLSGDKHGLLAPEGGAQ